MSAPFQTDASRPAALPTANIGGRNFDDEPVPTISSEEYLDQVEEEWNKKVDAEVETLVDGMVDLVAIASVCFCPSYRREQCILNARFRSEIKTSIRWLWSRFKRSVALSPW